MRHVVLLKQLQAFPKHVSVHRVSGAEGDAILVALDTSVSAYDRLAYPKAAVAAFISSDHPNLTAKLLPRLPRDTGIVFKLSHEADVAALASRFAVERRTAFISFTAGGVSTRASDVRITTAPGDPAFDLFETQGHERVWLEPLLKSGDAFACVLERDGALLSACFAFAIHHSIWEVGGVVTVPAHRGGGLGSRSVRTAVAELASRGLTTRYQVEENNEASIRLARSVGLRPFLTITHYEHERG